MLNVNVAGSYFFFLSITREGDSHPASDREEEQ